MRRSDSVSAPFRPRAPGLSTAAAAAALIAVAAAALPAPAHAARAVGAEAVPGTQPRPAPGARRHRIARPAVQRTSSDETAAERDRRLARECRGLPNAGACLGYAR
ncbi:MAG: hypothetical protein PGN26_12310 [Xylophilus ampelinus]